MMLNPAKCVFGVPAGKLLGFLVSNRGIEANPEKIKAITSLAKPKCINDVQRLVGRIAALSRFVSRLGEKAIPLYPMLKGTDNFIWSDAANEAFEDLKRQLANPPILAAPVIKNRCCYMWQLTLGLLVWLLWWSARRQESNIRSSGRFTISVRYLLRPSRGTRIGKNWCMGFSWQAGSLSSISKVIPSRWSALLLWGI